MSDNPQVIEDFFDRLKKRRILKRSFKILRRIFFSLVLLLLVGYILLQSKTVQNYLVQKVIERLSEDLNTTVSLDRIDVEFYDKLILEEFYLEDQQGDTLLYSKELKADFKTNLIQILSGRLVVDNIYLTDANLKLERDSAEQYNNLQFLVDYFKNDKPKKKKNKSSRPFLLEVNGVYLNNVNFIQDDHVRGQLFSTYVDEGEILIENLDLQNNRIDLASVILTKPVVVVTEKNKFPYVRSPEAELVKLEADSLQSIKLENDTVLIDSLNLPKPFIATVGHFKMIDGRFDYDQLRHSPVRTKPLDELDFKHLNVNAINIDIDSFHYSLDEFNGQINSISLSEESGFVLNQLSAEEAKISDKILQLNGMQLITPHSNIGDTLVMRYRTYRDFRDFNDRVKMTANFNNATVAIEDIMTFAPKLKKNKFFNQNKDEVVQIDGLVRGSVNRLRGKDVLLQLSGNTLLQGDFNTRDLSVKGEEFLALKLDRFRSNARMMRLLVPGFNVAPNNFDKLGNINFNGRFDGFFTDFVAFGTLSTDLGQAKMDMNMNLRDGRAAATYSGKLELNNFDLKTWTGNDNFGNISFVSEVKQGKGLTLETVDAILDGTIEEFTFKDYTYHNIALDGELSKNLFDGQLESKDKNVDFLFNGKIDFVDSLPKFDFDANINQLDLMALNLSKKPLALSGEIALDFVNFSLSDIEGDGAFYDFKITNGLDTFMIDTLIANSQIDAFNQRSFTVDSDVIELEMNGTYDFKEVPLLFTSYLVQNFPEFSERFNIKSKDKELKDSQFDFKIRIPNSKNLAQLIDPRIDTIRYAYAEGMMDNINDSLSLELEVPTLKFGNVVFNDVLLNYNGQAENSNILLDIYHTSINNKQHFEPLKLEGTLNRDTFYYDISSTNFTSVFDDLNLRGKFFLVDEYFQMQFLPSNLVILEDQWDIVENNYIRFGKGLVETNNFDLLHFDKRIVLESIEGTGLALSLSNFDLSLIDEWWDYDKLDFDGKFFVLFEAGNIFKMENMYATLIADSMKVNQDYLGELRLDVAMESLKDKIDGFITIKNGRQNLKGEGFVAPLSKNRDIKYTQDFDFNFELDKYPLTMLQYFIKNGISRVEGTLDSDVRFFGNFESPKINGFAVVEGLGVTIDYLQTHYTAPTGYLNINNDFLFDASDNVIYDSLGNTAKITGGIRHTGLKKLRLDVNMSSDNFLFLDTDKSDNELYYGYGIGSGDVTFTGSFQRTDIAINAKTGRGSKINIPVSYDNDASEVNFITFIEKDSIDITNTGKTDLRGVEVDMNLDVTPDAEVWLIFDERAGDIIKGRGLGNIQFQVFRNGDIRMFGDYEIEEGQYLYTYLNVVNKPFVVKRGGTIRWEGDPFGAIIDIEAEYDGLSTSIYNFIIEYLNTDDIKAEARAPTEVGLTMILTGPMLQPEINFDIEFPNLAGELKNYTDSKLRLIRQDQNELNRQVFGLLVIGGFLPNQNAGLQGTQSIFGINTVSELLSNQLSIYLTEILSEVFTDVDFVSGVDFKVNYNIYQADETVPTGDGILYGTEIVLGTKFDLFNDRLSLDVGGSYIDQGGQYFSGDVMLDYFVTKNRRLKVRFFRLSDQTIQGRRDKIGLGFAVRREFDSFGDFIKSMKKSAKDLRDED